jgi:hypothetical protein
VTKKTDQLILNLRARHWSAQRRCPLSHSPFLQEPSCLLVRGPHLVGYWLASLQGVGPPRTCVHSGHRVGVAGLVSARLAPSTATGPGPCVRPQLEQDRAWRRGSLLQVQVRA